jgi:Ca2+-binding RTX toxin-like protein
LRRGVGGRNGADGADRGRYRRATRRYRREQQSHRRHRIGRRDGADRTDGTDRYDGANRRDGGDGADRRDGGDGADRRDGGDGADRTDGVDRSYRRPRPCERSDRAHWGHRGCDMLRGLPVELHRRLHGAVLLLGGEGRRLLLHPLHVSHRRALLWRRGLLVPGFHRTDWAEFA